MRLDVCRLSSPEAERIYILPDGTTTNSREKFEKANLYALLRRFASQPELFDTPEISQAREDLRARLGRGEQIQCDTIESNCSTQYVKPDGSVTYLDTEFERAIAELNLRRFAFDRQQQLFPDGRVEQARADLRKRLASGESIDVAVYG